jgi:hypothetical protein
MGTLRLSLDVQSLNVQNSVLILETEQPKILQTEHPLPANVAGNGYTDKEFAQRLFGMLDERGWLEGDGI